MTKRSIQEQFDIREAMGEAYMAWRRASNDNEDGLEVLWDDYQDKLALCNEYEPPDIPF